MRGVLYRACVRAVMIYGCESWPMRKENEENLVKSGEENDTFGVSLVNREKSEDLRERLVEDIGVGVKKARLRWFGHVFRCDLDMGVKRAFLFKLGGKVGRGRPRRTYDNRLVLHSIKLLC